MEQEDTNNNNCTKAESTRFEINLFETLVTVLFIGLSGVGKSTVIGNLKRGMVKGKGDSIRSIHLPVTHKQAVGQGTKGYYSYDLVDIYNKAKSIVGEIIARVKLYDIRGLVELNATVLEQSWRGNYDIPYDPNEVVRSTEKPPKGGFTLIVIVLECEVKKAHADTLSELRNKNVPFIVIFTHFDSYMKKEKLDAEAAEANIQREYEGFDVIVMPKEPEADKVIDVIHQIMCKANFIQHGNNRVVSERERKMAVLLHNSKQVIVNQASALGKTQVNLTGTSLAVILGLFFICLTAVFFRY